MSKFITTVYGKSTINIYNDHAELILSRGRVILIDNDTDTVNFVKDRTWTVTNDGVVVSNIPSHIGLARYIINAPAKTYALYKNGNKFDCRRNNLVVSSTNNGSISVRDILNHKYDIEYDSSNKAAKVNVIGNANCEDTIIIVDDRIANDIASGKIHPYVYIEKNNNNSSTLRIPLKEYDKDDCEYSGYSNLGRYILKLEKGNPKCVYHIDEDRTNYLESNLIALTQNEYSEFVKDRKGYAEKIRKQQQVKSPKVKLESKPESTTKNPKGVVDIGNGFFFVSVYNEKTGTLDQLGTFTDKEEACFAYEKRVREICEQLAKDAYESLVVSLMEQYYE